MRMKTILTILAVIALLVAGNYIYAKMNNTVATPDTNGQSALGTYHSATYGISFQYPDSYVLAERESGNGERAQHTITLMDKTAAANIPVGGEGPPAITIDIFQNNLEKQTVENWINNSSASNYKLSPDGTLTQASVAGAPALAYGWDGLYRGASIVFAHKQNIVMLSMTSLTAEDQIIFDFANLVASMRLN